MLQLFSFGMNKVPVLSITQEAGNLTVHILERVNVLSSKVKYSLIKLTIDFIITNSITTYYIPLLMPVWY